MRKQEKIQKKLQKEVDDFFYACRCKSEWQMCRVSVEKDLKKWGYILTEYRKVQLKEKDDE